ncbi:pyroglutamyl-peptidase I [Pseudomonas sp. TMP9]|uniref:pyroglutamyl-peptidase I n=1 Tax=unclassified Pseudomonas TaxID=196821 RepID=UPI0030CD850B
MTKTILLTGFEPFAGDTLNSSWEVVRALAGQRIGHEHVVVSELLPCAFDDSLLQLNQLIALHQPEIVVAVGQASGRAAFSIERVAINLKDAAIPDNVWQQPVDQPVMEDGPSAYFSTLPIKAIVARLREHGIPAEVSQSAGTYVCNAVFYGLMHAASNLQRPVRAGFVHIPYLPEQAANRAASPSMAGPIIANGLRLALSVTLSAKQDLKLSGGATH